MTGIGLLRFVSKLSPRARVFRGQIQRHPLVGKCGCLIAAEALISGVNRHHLAALAGRKGEAAGRRG
jgi:hypothetical protein